MSFLSKITGQDAARGKKQAASEAQYGGNVGTQYLQGMKTESDLAKKNQAQADTDRADFTSTLNGGQDALNASVTAAMSAAMPDLFRTLQQTKESNIRRGMYNGETPTSYEGDVMSAFQKNIANSAGSQAMNMFNTQAAGKQHLFDTSTGLGESQRNTYYDLITGKLDRDQNKRNSKNQANGQLIGGLAQGAAAAAALLA